MVKKEYKQPLVEAITIQNSAILAGSVDAADGSTSEQNVKGFNFIFCDDEDDDDEEEW